MGVSLDEGVCDAIDGEYSFIAHQCLHIHDLETRINTCVFFYSYCEHIDTTYPTYCHKTFQQNASQFSSSSIIPKSIVYKKHDMLILVSGWYTAEGLI